MMLGQGSFGKVFLVEKIDTKKLYAMKTLDKKFVMAKEKDISRYAKAERNVLIAMNHPFIVKLHFAFQNDEKLFLVMDYCSG
jgi:serum/glucocorticoid-regulated kinase 2